MIDLRKGNFIHTIWFVGDGHSMDWMATLWRKKGDDFWRLDYRFRYYKDREAFNSKDEKRMWSATCDLANTEQAVAAVDSAQKVLVAKLEQRGESPKSDRVVCERDGSDHSFWIFEFGSRPWVNMMKPTKEQARKMGLDGGFDDD